MRKRGVSDEQWTTAQRHHRWHQSIIHSIFFFILQYLYLLGRLHVFIWGEFELILSIFCGISAIGSDVCGWATAMKSESFLIISEISM